MDDRLFDELVANLKEALRKIKESHKEHLEKDLKCNCEYWLNVSH